MKTQFKNILIGTYLTLSMHTVMAQYPVKPIESAVRKEIIKCAKDAYVNMFGECASNIRDRAIREQKKTTRYILSHLINCQSPMIDGAFVAGFEYDKALLGLEGTDAKWHKLVVDQCAVIHQVWGMGHGGGWESAVCEIEFHQVRNKWLNTIAATIQANNKNCVEK